MDVLNLSLGGGYHGNNDLLAKGLDNAVDAGVVVRGGGNSGPGPGTLGRRAARAKSSLSARAQTNISSASRSPIRRAVEQRRRRGR